MNKRKNRGMGNCISKINKDQFFVYDDLMKNDVVFKRKDKACPRNGYQRVIYGVSFHKEVFRNKCVGSVTSWGVLERPGTPTAPSKKDN